MGYEWDSTDRRLTWRPDPWWLRLYRRLRYGTAR
jgi:hypothetical protein